MANRGASRYPRTARVGELLREIVAEELSRLDDPRLDLVAVTKVTVDRELEKAVVWFDTLAGPEDDDEVVAALDQHRVRIQASVGRQARLRRTPHLVFRPDEVTRGAERIDGILAQLGRDADDGDAAEAPEPT
jgi:ribosome-binding factor A